MSNNNKNKQNGSWFWSKGKTNNDKTQSNDPIASDWSDGDSVIESEIRLANIFKQLDRNGNGRIDIQELTIALKEFGISQHYAEVGQSYSTSLFRFNFI